MPPKRRYVPSDSRHAPDEVLDWGQVSADALAKAKSRDKSAEDKRSGGDPQSDDDDEGSLGAGQDKGEDGGEGEDDSEARPEPSAKGKGKQKADEVEDGSSEPEGNIGELSKDALAQKVLLMSREELLQLLAPEKPRALAPTRRAAGNEVVDRAKPSKRARSQSPVVHKKRPRRIQSDEEQDMEADRDEGSGEEADKADEEADEADGEVDEADDGKLSKVERKKRSKVLKEVVRDSFKSLCGWDSLTGVPPTQVENNRTVYWIKDGRGIQILRPAWNRDFPTNWREWGKELMSEYRRRSKKEKEYATYLLKVSDAAVREVFRKGAWATAARNGKAVDKGTSEEDHLKRTADSRDTARRRQLKIARSEASVGTSLASKEFDFMFAPSAQSPQQSDSEDNGRVIRFEAAWQSKTFIDLKNALDQKVKKHQKKVVPVAYVTVDLPIKKLEDGLEYPGWVMNDGWIETHKGEYEEAKWMIDESATVKPNTSDLNKYGNVNRTYLPEIPKPAKPRPASVVPSIPAASRSASPVVAHANPQVAPMQGLPLIAAPMPSRAGERPDPIDPSLVSQGSYGTNAHASSSHPPLHHPPQGYYIYHPPANRAMYAPHPMQAAGQTGALPQHPPMPPLALAPVSPPTPPPPPAPVPPPPTETDKSIGDPPLPCRPSMPPPPTLEEQEHRNAEKEAEIHRAQLAVTVSTVGASKPKTSKPKTSKPKATKTTGSSKAGTSKEGTSTRKSARVSEKKGKKAQEAELDSEEEVEMQGEAGRGSQWVGRASGGTLVKKKQIRGL